MKVILCGYNWTGCKALMCLLNRKYDVYVYTHPSVNAVADLEGLCIKEKVSYSLEDISINNLPFIPDIICSIYYRKIISEQIIDCVNGRIFNLHPSLLPKYRGCSSLTWAIINGEKKCGYTYHYVDEKCDNGDIIIQKEIPIEEFDTQLTLYNRVMFESMRDFENAFDFVMNEKKGNPQIGSPNYYKRGCPLDGVITDDMDFLTQERMIRAMIYPPYPQAKYKGKEIGKLIELLRLREER